MIGRWPSEVLRLCVLSSPTVGAVILSRDSYLGNCLPLHYDRIVKGEWVA